MPAPTLIATAQIGSPWSQVTNIGIGVATLNYASALSTAANDLIVSLQGASDGSNSGQLTTTTTGLVYTQRTNLQNGSHCGINIATAPDGSGGTRTVVFNRASTASTAEVGGIAFQFRTHGGVGNVFTATDNVQTGNLTCGANSAVLVIITDWNAITGAQTWATINGSAPTSTFGVVGDASTWGVAGAYFADVGSAGSKTITLSTPNMTAETFGAIEILAGADIVVAGPPMMGRWLILEI